MSRWDESAAMSMLAGCGTGAATTAGGCAGIAVVAMSFRVSGWIGPVSVMCGAGRPRIHEIVSTRIAVATWSHASQPTTATILINVESGRPLLVNASTNSAAEGRPAGNGEPARSQSAMGTP